MTPSPLPPSPTIDTLISSISVFSTVLLSVLGLFLLVIGGIGGFLVWNGIELRKRAEEDLTVINNSRTQATESLKKTLEAGNAVVKTADEIVTIASNAKNKDKELTGLLTTFQQRKTAYSQAAQGTALLFDTHSLSGPVLTNNSHVLNASILDEYNPSLQGVTLNQVNQKK